MSESENSPALKLALVPRTGCWVSGTLARHLTVELWGGTLGSNLERSYGIRDENPVNLESDRSRGGVAIPSSAYSREQGLGRSLEMFFVVATGATMLASTRQKPGMLLRHLATHRMSPRPSSFSLPTELPSSKRRGC